VYYLYALKMAAFHVDEVCPDCRTVLCSQNKEVRYYCDMASVVWYCPVFEVPVSYVGQQIGYADVAFPSSVMQLHLQVFHLQIH
jgi:hypothetical protein